MLGSAQQAPSLRLDLFLWFARIARSRPGAQAIARGGHLRIGGRAVASAHTPVRIGDVLTFAQGGRVRTLKVESLPWRRGPPVEARALYSEFGAAIVPTSRAPAAGCP